jgi:hypothetical protein
LTSADQPADDGVRAIEPAASFSQRYPKCVTHGVVSKQRRFGPTYSVRRDPFIDHEKQILSRLIIVFVANVGKKRSKAGLPAAPGPERDRNFQGSNYFLERFRHLLAETP